MRAARRRAAPAAASGVGDTLRVRATGMRLTVPHYHQFGKHRRLIGEHLVDPASWDRLRLETETIFAFDPDPDDWDRRISTDTYQRRRAKALVGWLDRLEVSEISSYGVGPAPIECWIHRLRPKWRLRLTDFAPRTVARLRAHFPEAEIHHHDLREHPPLPADVHLMSCVDTEFSDQQWRRIYRRFAGATLLVYPCATLGVSTIVNELRQWLALKPPTPCGFWRTSERIEELLAPTHRPERLSEGGALGVAWLCRPNE